MKNRMKVMTLEMLTRWCPKSGRRQVVPEEELRLKLSVSVAGRECHP